MRAGNGRHRRPRQAPALLVTAGVAGAGIAMPFLGATGAQAADAGIWDRVAECESGGMWSANDQNGYYGGLQLDLENWQQYGGADYAPRPDLASRSQQISVAEKILDDQGAEFWSSCAERSDLDQDESRSPEVNPGDERGGSAEGSSDEHGSSSDEHGGSSDEHDSDGSSGSNDGSDRNDSSAGNDSGKNGDRDNGGSADAGSSSGSQGSDASHGQGSDASQGQGSGAHRGSAESPDTPSTGEGNGKHRANAPGTPGNPVDPDDSVGNERDDSAGAGRADRGDRGDTPGGGSGEEAQGGSGHKVRTGESLSAIAAENDVDGGWSTLYERNRQLVGDDPNLIHPGQQLRF